MRNRSITSAHWGWRAFCVFPYCWASTKKLAERVATTMNVEDLPLFGSLDWGLVVDLRTAIYDTGLLRANISRSTQTQLA
jgi:hypothetical protein